MKEKEIVRLEKIIKRLELELDILVEYVIECSESEQCELCPVGNQGQCKAGCFDEEWTCKIGIQDYLAQEANKRETPKEHGWSVPGWDKK